MPRPERPLGPLARSASPHPGHLRSRAGDGRRRPPGRMGREQPIEFFLGSRVETDRTKPRGGEAVAREHGAASPCGSGRNSAEGRAARRRSGRAGCRAADHLAAVKAEIATSASPGRGSGQAAPDPGRSLAGVESGPARQERSLTVSTVTPSNGLRDHVRLVVDDRASSCRQLLRRRVHPASHPAGAQSRHHGQGARAEAGGSRPRRAPPRPCPRSVARCRPAAGPDACPFSIAAARRSPGRAGPCGRSATSSGRPRIGGLAGFRRRAGRRSDLSAMHWGGGIGTGARGMPCIALPVAIPGGG